ncbi:MAG TPA: PAS domain-containing protein [Candidatus Acidoferrales bacterium]|nr:PAS domain-containing protein [Candidatus Acidoferrales bacterium]
MENVLAEPAQKRKTSQKEKVNILLVDDQPAKLLTYEAILGELDENFVQATSGRDALDKLLKMKDVAVILMDVSMPEMDGFETARLIREHPRFQRTAIIFISAIHLTDLDRVKGYERGAVDYISVPVNPELLRAKVTVFADLHRATRDLEKLNRELEERVRERTLELQESEAQFRAVANSIPQLAWMAEPNGSLMWYSDRWYEYTGLSKEEANGDAWKTRVDPESLAAVLKEWDERIARGKPFEMDFRLRGCDGVYRWFLTQVTPLRDSNGAIKHWFGARTDIHEQREIRRALEEAQERLVLAQKASHCGTFDFNVGTGVNFWSDELQRIYGFLPRLFPGTYQAWLDCVLPEDRAIAEEPFRLSDKEFETEFRIQRRDDGEVRWINSRGRIHRNAEGNIVRVVGLHIDITRTKRAEEDLKRAHDELETRVLARTAALRIAEDRLRRLSGRLMQSQDDERRRIARELHDSLGQYLVASKMSLDLASMNGSNSERIKECLADAINQIEKAISETRTISHLLHPPLLDEVGLESALVWYAEGFAKRSGIAVDVDIADSIGRLSTDIETAVFRVVQECLTNVHRHSGSQTASVRLYRNDSDLKLEVRDQGKGMPAGSLTGEAQSALGVGLQGIRERVLQLRGKLEIVSNEGAGTTVVATIPDACVSATGAESTSAATSQSYER